MDGSRNEELQRTDSTHVLAAIRDLNRLEGVGETLRAALNDLATVAPDWLRSWAPDEWYERYGRAVEEYRLPKGIAARKEYAELIGRDGMQLLVAVWAENVLDWLKLVPSLEILRQTWVHQYYLENDQVSLFHHSRQGKIRTSSLKVKQDNGCTP